MVAQALSTDYFEISFNGSFLRLADPEPKTELTTDFTDSTDKTKDR